MKVSIFEEVGDFAEDKDIAASIRERIRPSIEDHKKVTLDFHRVALVTQSFVHAMISDILRAGGEGTLKHIVFKGCNAGVRGIIETVVQYSLETLEE